MAVQDLGPTLQGSVWVEGEIKRRNRALVICVGFLGGTAQGGVINQSIGTAIQTAQSLGLTSVEISAIIANPQLGRVLDAGRLFGGYPGTTVYQSGPVTQIRIPVP